MGGISEHAFTATIMHVLRDSFGGKCDEVYSASPLLQYLNEKTRSAARGSKARGSFSSLYSIYVLVEDYLKHGYDKSGDYNSDHPGARFSELKKRTNELPFGSKLQNHNFNNRTNGEFKKFFKTCPYQLIVQDASRRYWINDKLLKISLGNKTFNIAPTVKTIIDEYVRAKEAAFKGFIESCGKMERMQSTKPAKVKEFVADLIEPNVDARVFEIVSFAILKQFYGAQSIYWGWAADELSKEYLALYKTGRVNANDGGIDFVMRPLGRFFQVTETVNVKKYFLDIDKVQRFPITFVVKSTDGVEAIRAAIEKKAEDIYSVKRVVNQYMECVEEIINVPILLERFQAVVEDGRLRGVINEIVVQSKVEFNC